MPRGCYISHIWLKCFDHPLLTKLRRRFPGWQNEKDAHVGFAHSGYKGSGDGATPDASTFLKSDLKRCANATCLAALLALGGQTEAPHLT
jgi:hypothetical protein